MNKLLNTTILKINKTFFTVQNLYKGNTTKRSYQEVGEKLSRINEALPKAVHFNQYSVANGGFQLKIS